MTLFSRLPDKLTLSARSILYAIGKEKSLYRFQDSKDVVLMFHNVLPNYEYDLNFRNISVHDFRKILIYLKKNFDVISLREMLNSKSTSRRVAITFDDGLINNLFHALPVLEEQKIHGTFFITTSRIVGINSLWPDELSWLLRLVKGDIEFAQQKFRRVFMNQFKTLDGTEKLETFLLKATHSEIEVFISLLKTATGFDVARDKANEDSWRIMNHEEIAALSKSVFAEVGSHCVTHRNLALLKQEDLLMELKDSKNQLEQICQKTVDMIAFPFGIYSTEILNDCKKVGYKHLIAVQEMPGVDCNFHHLCFRLGLYNDSSFISQLHLINKSFE